MKTAQQIIGLPVVSIFDGNEIGKVKNVIINASKGTIDFFVIDSGIRSLAGGVIPAERVLGIGEYALTIQQPDDISDIVKIPAAIELMQKNITVRGTRVLTKKGSLVGETGDIYINEDENYNITGVEFVPAKSETKSGIIPRSSIITFGKNLLVVQDDVIERLTETPSAIGIEVDEKKNSNLEPELQERTVSEAQPAASEEADKDDLFKIDFNQEEGLELPKEEAPKDLQSIDEADYRLDNQSPAPNAEEDAAPNATELFETRQRQYLVGKKVTKTIYDTSGSILVNAGEVITDKMIQDVKANGKLIELVMNYEE
ncbi:MAG: PRC-barrel domain-containing protein [Clostridia bacterium]|nr:PRC-barrel domain-containing protein [Clostridia bacterium]